MKSVLTTILSILLVQIILAQPGMLRKEFASNGIFTHDITSADEIQGVAYLEDGSYVAVGFLSNPGIDGVILRISAEGGLLWSKTIDVSGNGFTDIFESVVVIDNKILVQSNAFNSKKGGTEIVILSYNLDGALNQDFGDNGRTSYFYDNGLGVYEMETDENDNIYLIGRTLGFSQADEDGIIIKIDKNGMLDTNFGDGGYSKQSIGSFRTGLLNAMIIDGEVYAVGWYYATGVAAGGFYENGTLIKVKQDGSRDLDFGFNGTITFDVGSGDIINDVAQHGLEHFVIAANDRSPGDLYVLRYDLSGNLDMNFGTNGQVVVDLGGDDDADDIMVRTDMGIFLCGAVNTEEDFGVISLNADGTIDKDFAEEGILVVNIEGNDNLSEGILLPNGDLLLGGESDENNDGDVALVLVEGYPTCAVVTVEESVSGCGSVTYGGSVYDQSGTYLLEFTKGDGCDSTVTLQIDISEPSTKIIGLESCDPAMVNDEVYSVTGTYTQLLTNAEGCDSILTINYQKLLSSQESISVEACEAVTVNDIIYESSGTYTQMLTNADLCDSSLTVEVEIQGIESNIEVLGDTIFSTVTADSYQWVNCSNTEDIEGATASFFIPAASGEYALEVVNGTCSSLSDCLAYTTSSTNDEQVLEAPIVAPNPAREFLNIKNVDVRYEDLIVFDIFGRKVIAKEVRNRSTLRLDISSLVAGTYFLAASDEKGRTSTSKFMKTDE